MATYDYDEADQHQAEDEQEEMEVVSGEPWYARMPSWFISMVVHTILLVTLALLSFEVGVDNKEVVYIAPQDEVVEEEEELEELDEELPEVVSDDVEVTDVDIDVSTETTEAAEVTSVEADEPAPAMVELDPTATAVTTATTVGTSISNYSGNGLGLRSQGNSTALRAGGTNKSQAAVAKGLKWLAAHQYPDGGWSYNHAMAGGCKNQCDHPGTLTDARNGATGQAILPFLGAGQTHKTGKYQAQIRKGLAFLVNHMDKKNGGLHEKGGTMYSHGIAAICLTEAYAMTKDAGLKGPAQAAINFIVYAQDPAGGGWRYNPRSAGDTSVVGWQLMALKSGFMGYLDVPPKTAVNAMKFLDSVQYGDYGALYGYTGPDKDHPACTAIGLLCRMYYGWKQDHPGLSEGVNYLSKRGPSKNNMYYNYYATQVMRHFGGEPWQKWNSVMRDQLVDSQAQDGHREGSWFFPGGDHGADRGGRLYMTAMAVMVLEVYYRHMPIYAKQSTEGEMPLE